MGHDAPPVERLGAQLDALAGMTRAFAEVATAPDALCRAVARETANALHAYCVVGLVSADDQWFEPAAMFDGGGGDVTATLERLVAVDRIRTDGPHPLARGLRTGEVAVLPAVTPEYIRARFSQGAEQEAALALEVRTAMFVPLTARGATFGGFVVARYGANTTAFDDDDVRFARQIAAHAALAITNARLLDERRRNAERLRALSEASKDFAAATGDLQRLLDMVAQRLSETIGELAAIRIVDDDGRILDTGASAYHPDPEVIAIARQLIALPQRIGEGVSGRVAATGQPIRLTAGSAAEFAARTEPQYRALLERLGTRSVLAVPLVARGRVAGVITLTRWSTGEPYSDDDLLFAQDLASHAALALSNSRLLAAAQAELAERKRAEQALVSTQEQLRQAQKMEAVGRLAGGVAHDFNNLLSVVLSYCSFLSDELAPDDPMRADLGEIRQAGERAADLTRQLLAFSRQQVTEPRILDLNDVVRGIDKMLHRLLGEDVALRIRPAPRLGRVKADPGHIEQVIMNLAVNARDAMPHGGTLTIETANVELDERYAREHLGVAPGPHVMLAMSDTGTGMDKATQERMFEPFFTTKERGKGTGLGLATVFGIVKQAGGSIWVYSELGKGTTFKVYLPQTQELAQPRTTTTEIASLRGSETILLVEDDEQVRVVARGILKRNGYTLLEARNGEEAVHLCAEHPGAIDLLLTDVVMPRMSGRELSELLLVRRPDMKVLFMSGYTEDAIIQHRVVSPGVALLQKPLTPKSLLRKVRAVLDAWDQ